VLELGCGLGLPALAAALRGADVLATDWAEDAIELLQRNAERNGLFVRVARVRWSEPEPLLRAAPWDLVLGADLLYEARNAEQLAELLPGLGGDLLLAEPGRPYAKEFLERFQAEPIGDRIYQLAVRQPSRRSPPPLGRSGRVRGRWPRRALCVRPGMIGRCYQTRAWDGGASRRLEARSWRRCSSVGIFLAF